MFRWLRARWRFSPSANESVAPEARHYGFAHESGPQRSQRRRTVLPFRDPAGRVAIIADDENLRLAVQQPGAAQEVDYAALRRAALCDFSAVEVHVFSARPVPPWALGEGVIEHRKCLPGKNVDGEVYLWYSSEFDSTASSTLLIASGDVDFLPMREDAMGRGLACGFLLPPPPSSSRHLTRVPHSWIETDVLLGESWKTSSPVFANVPGRAFRAVLRSPHQWVATR